MTPSSLLRRSLCLLSLLSLPVLAQSAPFSFGVIGDTPYSRHERQQLPLLIEHLNQQPLQFVTHVGDIKNGSSVCSDAVFTDVLGVLQASRHPLVYTPGDNEWTDCHRSNNGGFDPLERLARVRELFFAQPGRTLGQQPLTVTSQASQPAHAAYRENVRWQVGPVVFVTLNLPGSNNNWGKGSEPSAEYQARQAANRAWLDEAFALAHQQQARGLVLFVQANPEFEAYGAGKPERGYQEFLDQLLAQTRRFAGEVLFVHGDTHAQRIDQPLRDPATQQVQANFTRLETYGSPFMGWVRVTVNSTQTPLFRFLPQPWPVTSSAEQTR